MNQMFEDALQAWKQRTEVNDVFSVEWGDYLTLMKAFVEALERAPLTPEACAEVEIERLLISELEHLADTVQAVFPLGGFEEFRSYLTVAAREREEAREKES